MIYNPPIAVQTALDKVAADYDAGKFITTDQLNLAIQQAANSLASAPSWQTSTIAAGTASIERRGKFTYAQIETEGLIAADDLTALSSASPFNDGDFLILRPASIGHVVNVILSGVTNGQAKLSTPQDGLFLIYAQGWREIGRWPNQVASTKPLETDSQVITTNAINYTASVIRVRALSGEVLADATVTITAAGATSGSILLYADDGSGVNTLIGQASYASSTTPSAIATQLRDNVDDLGIYGTANLSGASFDVVAPVGTGVGGNSHSLSATVSGGLTATVGAFFGGSNGVEAADTLNSIIGEQEGSYLILHNANTAESITLGTSGNIGALSPIEILPGDSMPLLFSSSANKWLPYERRGKAIGFLSMAGNATATTIANTTDYFPIAGTTTAFAANAGFIHGSNSLELAGASGIYEVQANCSFSNGANDVIILGISVNGITQAQVMRSHAQSGSHAKVLSASFPLILETGDIVRATVRNASSTSSVTVSDLQLYLKSAY